ncbi:phosphonate C-P lyase system protein PhnL [Microbacteriaceae bacterium K1510]|nr:phosphonate C-P lyase system protein PhnL [Microbacteriaceae bacterium K1510]
MTFRLVASGIAKRFTVHQHGGTEIHAVANVSFAVAPGECIVLGGASGSGKSSILKMVYGTYAVDHGRIVVMQDDMAIDIATADARSILELRRHTIGYVSQFLRAVPRVSARDVVAEPLILAGALREEAYARAEKLLARLNVARRLWELPPATFSGGEQQRVNVARGFIAGLPLLLLDEPTASLDDDNRAVVANLIGEMKAAGVAILGIFHDAKVRDTVADRVIDVQAFARADAA